MTNVQIVLEVYKEDFAKHFQPTCLHVLVKFGRIDALAEKRIPKFLMYDHLPILGFVDDGFVNVSRKS